MKYRFAEFEIDLNQQELRRLGEAVHIEPQVFDVIVHLVRNHDRIVSKDELIETIWNGRIISEAALSSRINSARRALGDNGTDQALIRTLHKRGFRFVGDVRTISAQDAEAEPARLVPDGAVAPGDLPVRVSVAAEVSRLDDIVSESVKAEATARPSIAVLPFGNMSDDPENDYFSYGLTEDIIRLLARNRWLSVISRHSTIAFQGRVVDAREIGEQLGARYVMVGSVRKNRDTVTDNGGTRPGGGWKPIVVRQIRTATRVHLRYPGGNGAPDRRNDRAGAFEGRAAARRPQGARKPGRLGLLPARPVEFMAIYYAGVRLGRSLFSARYRSRSEFCARPWRSQLRQFAARLP